MGLPDGPLQVGILAGRNIQSPASARLVIDGRSYLNFFGSGYLALTEIPQIREAAMRAIQAKVGFCRQIPGSFGAVEPVFDAVEREIAQIMGTETSLYFASGYLIGMICLAGMADDDHVLFIDEHAHFNLVEAARASSLPTHFFKHCDADALATGLRTFLRRGRKPLVLTDGVFATQGNLAPLGDYADILRPLNGGLLVDESHAFGIVGDRGRGAAEFCQVDAEATLGATLSKACCAHGAFVCCSRQTADRLRDRPVVRGSSAGSPISAVVAAACLRYVQDHPSIRDHVAATASYFRKRLRSKGIEVIETPAAIVSFEIGDAAQMRMLQKKLFARGIFIYHSTYLGAGAQGCIRCAVFRDHTREDIDQLVDALA